MKEEELTCHEAIIKFLEEYNYQWIPGYYFIKVTLYDKWIGSSGYRRADELASVEDCPEIYKNKVERAKGKDLLSKGVFSDAFGKPVVSKYSYFRAIRKVEPGRLF